MTTLPSSMVTCVYFSNRIVLTHAISILTIKRVLMIGFVLDFNRISGSRQFKYQKRWLCRLFGHTDPPIHLWSFCPDNWCNCWPRDFLEIDLWPKSGCYFPHKCLHGHAGNIFCDLYFCICICVWKLMQVTQWDFTDVTLVSEDTYCKLDWRDSSNWEYRWRWWV